MTAPITWAEATSPILWSNIGINWNTAAKGNSVTLAHAVGGTGLLELGPIGFTVSFGANVGETLVVEPTKPEAITMALTAEQAVGHNHTVAESAIYGADLTSPVTNRLDAVESITFAMQDTSTFRPITEFTDEPIYTVNVGMAGSTSLLWNEEDEVTTTWTKVDYPN